MSWEPIQYRAFSKKTLRQRPCWCPKAFLRHLNLSATYKRSFFPMNLHNCSIFGQLLVPNFSTPRPHQRFERLKIELFQFPFPGQKQCSNTVVSYATVFVSYRQPSSQEKFLGEESCLKKRKELRR